MKVKPVRAAALMVLAATALAAPAAAQPPITSVFTHTDVNACALVTKGEEGQDWFIRRCSGLFRIPIWLAFSDSTELHVGFGAKRNTTGPYSSGGPATMTIEWRGRRDGSAFKPFAAIVRLRRMAETSTTLAVFRLRSDGTSCLVGEAGGNAEAGRIADAAATSYRCIQEPQIG
jgi:hypothetical protein